MEKLIINNVSCDGCGVCVQLCPQHVLALIELPDAEIKKLSFLGRLKIRVKGKMKSFVQNSESCNMCGTCIKNCHEHAIKISK